MVFRPYFVGKLKSIFATDLPLVPCTLAPHDATPLDQKIHVNPHFSALATCTFAILARSPSSSYPSAAPMSSSSRRLARHRNSFPSRPPHTAETTTSDPIAASSRLPLLRPSKLRSCAKLRGNGKARPTPAAEEDLCRRQSMNSIWT
jgi:hypothetical protein